MASLLSRLTWCGRVRCLAHDPVAGGHAQYHGVTGGAVVDKDSEVYTSDIWLTPVASLQCAALSSWLPG